MERNRCYCDIRQKDPDYYKKQGIPDGYCGFCSICKKPGHTCHVPAGLPYTGTWCDEHYQLIYDAFSPGFETGKTKLYFHLSFLSSNNKNIDMYSEVIGDMPFRFIRQEDGKLLKYKHGSVKVDVSSWLIPFYAWTTPLDKIDEQQFNKLWDEASEP